MPKNRRRNSEKGAKSISIRTKFKIGGRKSGTGVRQASSEDLRTTLVKGTKHHNAIVQELRNRGAL